MNFITVEPFLSQSFLYNPTCLYFSLFFYMSKTLFTFIFFIGLLFSPFVSFAQSGDVYEFTAPIFLKELPPADQYGVQYTIDRNRTILQARTLSGLTTKNALQTLIIAPKKNGISLSQNICFGVSRDI